MSADDDRMAKGDRMRRRVMSDAYVDSRRSARNDFSGDLDDMITQFAWGEVWTRPGLDPKIRSVITLTITATRSQWDEFRIHVRGAINNGMSAEELKEALLHIAVYGGFPAARSGFREAQVVLKEMEAERAAQA